MILYADIAGERLDAFLARTGGSISRSAAQKLMESGCVTVNGKPGKKNDRLKVGDAVSVELPDAQPVDIAPKEMPLDIVYEDEDVLVINKPKGLVVHPAAGHQDDTLVNGLLFAKGSELSGINGELRPGIVHRIDKDTSGLLIVAKNDFAHQGLSAQLSDHSLYREYEAIVRGMKEAGIHIPVVAIGGITVDDIPSIMGTGVDGIALSGAVLNAEDPAAMTEKIITAIRQSKNE